MVERLALEPDGMRASSVDLPPPDPLKGGDIFGWAMNQSALLRSGRFNLVDISNVADEIEDVGRSDYRALESKYEIVLLHILKWDHQPERRSRSWSNPIFEQRLQIERLLRQSPSLRARQAGIIKDAYSDARRLAARQTALPLAAFPEDCPYSLTELMGASYEVDER